MSRSLPAVLARHSRRYPLLEARDIYKLIHQGAFGPGHIISSVASARRALATECRLQNADCRMQNGGDEDSLEPIDPENKLVRVNLRPLLGQGGSADTEWLIGAMVESARRVKGDPKLMKRRLAAAVRWCRTNLPGEAAGLERIAGQAEESGYPAYHHSSAYARAYRPAYRVVLSDCLKRRALGRDERAGRMRRAVGAAGR